MASNRRAYIAACCLFFAARSVGAQSMSDVLTFLLTNQSVQTGSVERDRNAAQATSDTISHALLANLATLPVPTSSGAFTVRLNPALGTVERVTQTFGPSFVDRAQTNGRGQASFSLTFQHFRFDSLDGRNLRDGSFVTTANQFVDEQTPFDTDRLTLNIDASVATVSASVGVTDHLDISFAAPIVSLRIDGTRIDTYRGRTFTQATASGQSIGLADAVVRTKYTISGDAGSGIAAAADVRLPTGRQEDLLGVGSASLKLAAIGSIDVGRVSAHGNAGVTLGGLARELSYNAAIAAAVASRLTLVGELLGRRIDSPGHVVAIAAPHPTIPGVETIRLVPDATMLDVVTFVPGFKWNLSDTWVFAGNVSVPLTRSGLTATVAPFVGLEYVLGH
jgi:hypothetical protein